MINKRLSIKPDFLALAAEKSGFFPGLYESQSVNEKIGRYDILFAAPSLELVAFDQSSLNQLLSTIDAEPSRKANDWPFQWGWMVYFSYESAYLMEPKLSHLISQSTEPLAIAMYCQGCIIHDRLNHETRLFAQSEAVAAQITQYINQVNEYHHHDIHVHHVKEEAGDRFKGSVVTAKELIKSGDIYQANLSRQYTCEINGDMTPADIYANLKKSNPSPFASMLQSQKFAIVSSSPERLFSINQGVIETRPIAGTRPRSDDKVRDLALIEELIKTPKERAEHIMLIDLERNDIGKVCEIGSVEVDELMVIETYAHVHHIVSNVKGRLKQGITVVDAIKALFPGGTITGCPKIRCMEIIHEIESRNRGAYTGSLGYINHDGQTDFNILIRTICIDGNQIKFNAGAGIVFDSSPQAELTETRHKAKGMIKALMRQS